MRPGRSSAALFGLLLLTGCSSEQDPPPAGELVARTFVIGGSPWGVAAAGEQVWVSDAATGRLVLLARDGTPVRELPWPDADRRTTGLVVQDGRLWVAGLGGVVASLPLQPGSVPVAGAVPGEPSEVALDAERAWAPGHGPGGRLVRLDLRTLRTLREVELPESPFAADLAGDVLWVAGLDARVFRLDADTGQVLATTAVGPAPRGLAVADGGVWVSLRDSGEVVRLDERAKDPPRRVRVGGAPWPVAADGREVWVADGEGRLLRLDSRSLRVTHEVRVPAGARALALTPTAVWVSGAGGTVTRVERP